jgi:hypothetical protein
MLLGGVAAIVRFQVRDQGCDPGYMGHGAEPLYIPGVAGGAFAGVGLGLLMSGIVYGIRVPLSFRRSHPPIARRFAMAFAGAGIALATIGATVVVSTPQLVSCWSG